ncbi:Uncharacterised protein [Mycobacteroides abscessus subsp. abscessus]|nr:Uncharacterised protein [Mycobacteroides abscessus subsp. abscessus]
MLKRHSGISSTSMPAGGSDEPPVQPLVLQARPRECGRPLHRSDVTIEHRNRWQHPHRDDVVGRYVDYRTGFM